MKKEEIISQPLVALVGPTAIGKTVLSLSLAQEFNCEIVSVDSMQVYRFMDIGTAKATREERGLVRHHLIDIVDPDESYDAARFALDAKTAIADIISRGKVPLLTGGTGLYLKALFEGFFSAVPANTTLRIELQERLELEGANKLHEELRACDYISAKRIHVNDKQRLLRALEIYLLTGKPWSEHLHDHKVKNRSEFFTKTLIIGLTCDRSVLYNRINSRCETMLNNGLEDEVRSILAKGYSRDLKSLGSIGYRHMIQYMTGELDHEKMVNLLARDTRRYAKRQYTWFSKIKNLNWIDVSARGVVFQTVKKWL